MPDPGGPSDREDAEGQRLQPHHQLRTHQDLALGQPVREKTAPQGEEQDRQELESGRDAQRGTRLAGERENEPVLRHPLHPGARVRHHLARDEEPEVAVGERAERRGH